MDSAWIWLGLLLASWFAATISASAGFGGALVLLPLLVHVVGVEHAVPILTVAQLLGNLSRAGLSWGAIHWRPVLLFTAGAVPASVVGAWAFVRLPNEAVAAGIGFLLIGLVVLRRTFSFRVGERGFAAAGALVGFLSALAGSAGPLGAAFFLGLNLAPTAYVASEAVTATLMHVTKILVYQRYALVGATELLLGLLLGAGMVAGSWTGKRLIERMPRDWFTWIVELLLVFCGLQMIAAALL